MGQREKAIPFFKFGHFFQADQHVNFDKLRSPGHEALARERAMRYSISVQSAVAAGQDVYQHSAKLSDDELAFQATLPAETLDPYCCIYAQELLALAKAANDKLNLD